jgi:hypothetical protein
MQPLVSSFSAGDCLVHRFYVFTGSVTKEFFLFFQNSNVYFSFRKYKIHVPTYPAFSVWVTGELVALKDNEMMSRWVVTIILFGVVRKKFTKIRNFMFPGPCIFITIPISRPTDATWDGFLFSIYMCITLHVSSVKRSSSEVPHRTYSLQYLYSFRLMFL